MTTSYVPRSARDGLLARVVRSAAGRSARRPRVVIALWLVLIFACVAAGAMTGTQRLTGSEAGVGESARADARLAQVGLADPAVESILVRSHDAAATRTAAGALERRARALSQVSTVRGPDDDAALSKAGGRVVLVQATLRGDPDTAGDRVEPLENAVAAVRSTHRGVTLQQAGPGSIDKEVQELVGKDLQRAELVSLPITLVILVLAFGALVAASVPLLLGITAVAGALGALGVVSHLAPMDDSAASLVVLIGLAVGVDYSLFYIRRERDERRAGRGPHAALEAAAATVGRAVLVSGLTVMAALAGLVVPGLAVFTSMGLATIIVVAIAVVGSLTVLPATLALLGDRVDRGRVPGLSWLRTRRAERGGPWVPIAQAVTRRPAAALISAVCLLGALTVPVLDMRTAGQDVSAFPAGEPVVVAHRAVDRAFPGAPSAAQIVVTGQQLDSADARRGLQGLGHRALAVTRGTGEANVRIARDGRTAAVAVPMPDRGARSAAETVAALREHVAPTAERIEPGARALVTGQDARDADFTDRLSTMTPVVIAFVLGLGFILLIAAFRSPALAAAVMGLNLLSVGAAYGVLVAVFQHRWAEGLLGFTSNGTIVDWMPLLSFVILFGLSMDYTVLLLERVREARRAGLSPREAAAESVVATGGAVTSAAVVMVAIFAIFASLRLLAMKQLGVGLAAAVLLDATVVRAVALPAVVALLGERGPRARVRRRRAAGWDHGRPAPAAASDGHAR
jgi:RND superfamily putative drug exporter